MRAEIILRQPVKRDRWNCRMTITPEQAKDLLEGQPPQRPVQNSAVQRFMADMQRGAWEATHQGLAFDESGLLLDGQHRLWACFMSGHAFTTMVFFNEPRVLFDVLDGGNVRTPAQLAQQKGQFGNPAEANSGVAAARFLWAFDMGKNPVFAATFPGFSSRVADAVLLNHPGISEMIAAIPASRLRPFALPRGATVALFALFHEVNAELAAVFLHEIATGENLTDGDPALTLRNSGLSAKTRMGTANRDMVYRLARAWNARCAGRRLERLYGAISPTGERGRAGGIDLFPEIAGYRRRPLAGGAA
jgi:hypothetical protein